MNTNGLGKLYGPLTPAERLPLILAASRRGDEVEKGRLTGSAGVTELRVPDYFARAQAFQEASTFHLITLLDHALKHWQAWGLWGWSLGDDGGNLRKSALKLHGIAQWHGYHFQAHEQAWAQFCTELNTEPLALLDFMPGYDVVEHTRTHVERMAHTHEEATLFLRFNGIETTVPATVEDMVQAHRKLLADRERFWDGG